MPMRPDLAYVRSILLDECRQPVCRSFCKWAVLQKNRYSVIMIDDDWVGGLGVVCRC